MTVYEDVPIYIRLHESVRRRHLTRLDIYPRRFNAKSPTFCSKRSHCSLMGTAYGCLADIVHCILVVSNFPNAQLTANLMLYPLEFRTFTFSMRKHFPADSEINLRVRQGNYNFVKI